MYLAILIGGFGGGALRGLVGFLGLAELTSALAVVIGYAGGDFLENLYKIVLKKPSLYTLPKDLK